MCFYFLSCISTHVFEIAMFSILHNTWHPSRHTKNNAQTQVSHPCNFNQPSYSIYHIRIYEFRTMCVFHFPSKIDWLPRNRAWMYLIWLNLMFLLLDLCISYMPDKQKNSNPCFRKIFLRRIKIEFDGLIFFAIYLNTTTFEQNWWMTVENGRKIKCMRFIWFWKLPKKLPSTKLKCQKIR